jgi:hypothetical protein
MISAASFSQRYRVEVSRDSGAWRPIVDNLSESKFRPDRDIISPYTYWRVIAIGSIPQVESYSAVILFPDNTPMSLRDRLLGWALPALIVAFISLGIYFGGREQQATEWLEKGHKYHSAKGVTKDYGQALQCYEKAASYGSSDAMNMIGRMAWKGEGGSTDYERAREWFEKSAHEDNASAMDNLGDLYAEGLGVQQDKEKARSWYEKGARAGDSTAMTNLGKMYFLGDGVPRDYVKARRWLENAAEKGEPAAMQMLMTLYAEGGYGIKADYTKSREWQERWGSLQR